MIQSMPQHISTMFQSYAHSTQLHCAQIVALPLHCIEWALSTSFTLIIVILAWFMPYIATHCIWCFHTLPNCHTLRFQCHTLRASVFHHSYPDVLTCEFADKMKVRLRTRSRLANICPWLLDHSMKLRKGVCPGHHSFRHCHPSSPCHPSSCACKVHR